MPSELWMQRGKLLIAFAFVHHSGVFLDVMPWVFLRGLQDKGWPDDVLREVVDFTFDGDLFQGGDLTQPVFMGRSGHLREQANAGAHPSAEEGR